MWSLCFGLLSAFALTGFILTIVYKEKIDDGESIGALILFTALSFIVFTIMCSVTYKTNEELYSECIKNVNKESYCIKYLGN